MECEYVIPLFDFVKNLCTFNGIDIETSCKDLIFSSMHKKPAHVINFLCTFCKQLIYRKRCKDERISVELLKN